MFKYLFEEILERREQNEENDKKTNNEKQIHMWLDIMLFGQRIIYYMPFTFDYTTYYSKPSSKQKRDEE